GYAGGKSALYELIHAIRPKPTRLITRFEGLPGEFTQHDFGEVDVRFLDGTTKRVHFFGLQAEVLALDRSLPGAERAGGDPGPYDDRSLRLHGRHLALGRVRPAEDD